MGKTTKIRKPEPQGPPAPVGGVILPIGNHLTDREVFMLIEGATETGRNKERDRCLLLLTYRHSFRVYEVCGLPLDHVDIDGGVLHVNRRETRSFDHAPAMRR